MEKPDNQDYNSITEQFKNIEPELEKEVEKEISTSKQNKDADFEACELRKSEAEAKEKELKNEKLALENKNLSQSIAFRRNLTFKLQKFIIAWMLFLGVVVVCQGINNAITFNTTNTWFYLPENVIIALLGSTTATFVGLFWVVIKYFFNTKD